MKTSASRPRSTASCWRRETLLIGVNRSPYTRRVAITLAAYGVPYEQRAISGFGNREEVRKHNPLGRIPALVLDDRRTLVQSMAIMEYFEETQPAPPLLPADAAGRARACPPAVGMPVYPVGTLKSLNSPYCIKDFQSVGSEFGSLTDLRALVDGTHATAHITFAREPFQIDPSHGLPRFHRTRGARAKSASPTRQTPYASGT